MKDVIMAEFVAQLDEINTLAESSKGFIWRLKGDGNNAIDILPFPDSRIIVNMSVWESLEDLENYAFNSHHANVMKRRRTWFERFEKPATALWYIPAGHEPSLEEAKKRLAHLQDFGASPYVFDFKKKFEKPL
jgi:Domain of unknown function (DUF3291)